MRISRRALLLSCPALAYAAATPAYADRRTALVIGEMQYFNGQKPLSNPGRDALLIGRTLREDGFGLYGNAVYTNLTNAQLRTLVVNWIKDSAGADVALFYFSGHGMEVGGVNYLAPVDLNVSYTPGTVGMLTLPANLVVQALDQMNVRLKIMLLDACRDNPFIASRGEQGGLAQMNAPAGTLIGFAAQPGATAADGPAGGNSPYAHALAGSMETPGLDLFAAMTEAGLAVMQATNSRQQPWIAASPIAGRFYFRPPAVVASVPSNLYNQAPLPTPSAPVSSGQSFSYTEQAYTLLARHRYGDAAEMLSHGIEVDAESSVPHSYLGFTRYLQGLDEPDLQRRLEYFRTGFPDLDAAIRLDPGYAAPRRHRGNMILATYIARMSLGLQVNDILYKAFRDLHDAATIDPTSHHNAAALGMSFLFAQRYDDATQWFGHALELRPKYAAAFAGRCMAQRLSHNWTAAQEDARSAAAHSGDLSAEQCLRLSVDKLWYIVRPDLG